VGADVARVAAGKRLAGREDLDEGMNGALVVVIW